jgi:hypothetical protein
MANRLECKSSKDPLVRIGIGIAMCIGLGAYCALTPEAKPEVPFGEDINAHVKWWMYILGPWVGGVAAIIVAAFWARAFKRSLVADDAGLSINGKAAIAWDAIVALRPAAKGLLFVDLKDGVTIKLDSYHYQNFKEMVALMEARVAPAGAPAGDADVAPAEGE